jgi:putative PIN family toxin of toxin-antitoxin system
VPERFLRLAESGGIRLVTSDDTLTEVAKTLRGDKFAWPEPEIDRAVQQLCRIAERVKPAHEVDVIKVDPSDNRILECAEAGKADYIVTGDKRHILPLNYAGIPIVLVTDFLRHIPNVVGAIAGGTSATACAAPLIR